MMIVAYCNTAACVSCLHNILHHYFLHQSQKVLFMMSVLNIFFMNNFYESCNAKQIIFLNKTIMKTYKKKLWHTFSLYFVKRHAQISMHKFGK